MVHKETRKDRSQLLTLVRSELVLQFRVRVSKAMHKLNPPLAASFRRCRACRTNQARCDEGPTSELLSWTRLRKNDKPALLVAVAALVTRLDDRLLRMGRTSLAFSQGLVPLTMLGAILRSASEASASCIFNRSDELTPRIQRLLQRELLQRELLQLFPSSRTHLPEYQSGSRCAAGCGPREGDD